MHHSHSVKTQLAPLGGCHVAGSINPRCLLYNSIILRVLLVYELSIFTMHLNLYEFAIVFFQVFANDTPPKKTCHHAAAPRNQFEVAEKKMQALLKACVSNGTVAPFGSRCHALPSVAIAHTKDCPGYSPIELDLAFNGHLVYETDMKR